MTTLKDLTRVRSLKLKVDSTRKRMQMLLDSASSVAVQLTGMPRGGGRSDKLERYVDDSRELSFTLLQRLTEYEQELERIEKDVEQLPPKEEQIIRLYYFEGLYWHKVSERLNYSEKSCRRLRDLALKRLLEMRG